MGVQRITMQRVASVVISSTSSGVSAHTRASRLTVAPLIPLLLAFASGIAIDREACPLSSTTWINLALAALAVGCLWLKREWASSLTLFATAIAVGGAWHHFWWNDRSPQDLFWSVTETPRPAWVSGVITELLGTRTTEGYGPGDPPRVLTRMVLAITGISDGKLWKPANGRSVLTVDGDRTDLHAGQPIQAAGQLSQVAGPLNPGEFDYREFLRAQGIDLRLSVDSPSSLTVDAGAAEWKFTRWMGNLRAYCRARLTSQLSDQTAPLASALILGQREEIDPEINDAFARTGTTHLLAISGLQLQALAFSLLILFRLLNVPRRPAYFAVALVTMGYAVLVGLAPSVVRSAVMTLAFCVAAIARRPTRSANTLALAGFVTLAWNPINLADVGCQLSFLAIAALIWLVPPALQIQENLAGLLGQVLHHPAAPIQELKKHFESGWHRHVRRAGAWVVGMVMVSTVVWVAALPLVALKFHLVSPIGILLNIPLIPLTSMALLLGALGLALGLVWTPLGFLPIQGADLLLCLTEAIVRWGVARSWGHWFVAGPSSTLVLVFYGLLGLAAVATWIVGREARGSPRPAWPVALWCAVPLTMVPGWLLNGVGGVQRLEADILAVGHGLAVSLRLESGNAILYDCGRMGDPRMGRRIIAPALWSRGITRLDQVILSHADQDHYNALPDLLDRFKIGEVVIPTGFVTKENPGARVLLDQVRDRGIPVRTIAARAAWDHGSTRFRVLHPSEGWHPEASDNARSLVLDVEQNGRHLLLTGDLDQMGVVELAGLPTPEPPIELMLAPHHGGRTANTSMLYAWARPRTVVVSQRPTAPGTTDALTPLERSDIPLLRTWQRGAIHFRWTPNGIIAEGFLDHHDQPRSEPRAR
jgi:competence protein ComEC